MRLPIPAKIKAGSRILRAKANQMEFGARSDTGRVRKNNEDSLAMSPEINLFVLSDGMGGLASGEIASRLAVDTVVENCSERSISFESPRIADRAEGVSEASHQLVSAIELANQVIQQSARENAAQLGMGATIAAVRCVGERMSVAHVGDSRVYRLRGDCFEQLTQDHSLVAEQLRRGDITAEEASGSRLQNVLVRALGIDAEVETDVAEEILMEGDTVLLCTDGLTREVSDRQIAAVLSEAKSAQDAADRLVDMANQAGGRDNITAIVLRSNSQTAGAIARIGRLGKWLRRLGE
jgi:serine/threonine protein phosphatase PrpC